MAPGLVGASAAFLLLAYRVAAKDKEMPDALSFRHTLENPNFEEMGRVLLGSMAASALGGLLGVAAWTMFQAYQLLPHRRRHSAILSRSISGIGLESVKVEESQLEDDDRPPAGAELCSGGDTPFPEDLLHEQFLRQTEVTPNGVAVQAVSASWTYSRLRLLSQDASLVLREAGVSEAHLVALFLEGDMTTIISIFGIWMAGGAWMPIDREAPPERVAALLQEGEPSALVCSDPAPFTDIPYAVLCPDASGERLLLHRAGAPHNIVAANQATMYTVAQVIYTSGSTGTPKGVVFSHRRLAHACHFFATQLGIRAETKVMQKTPYIWSVFRHEVYPALTHGGTVVLATAKLRKDPFHLAEVLTTFSVELLIATPTILELVLDAAIGPLPSLQNVVCMGEGLSKRIAEKAYSAVLGPNFCLYNFYGSTETENCVYIAPRPGSDPWERLRGNFLPAGRPQPCVSAYVLDGDTLEPLPGGAAGEICFGGILSDGYWRRPELTSERFLQHPVLGRVYRTGDLGRWSSTGDLEVLGRLDRQVKIRGIRIELEEVEAQLREALAATSPTATADAAVLAVPVPGVEGHLQLIAFTTPSDRDIHKLRASCEERMPPYMVPTKFSAKEALPRLPNQKVDLQRLKDEATLLASSAEEETTMVTDSLGRLRGLTRAQLAEDRWIQHQQAFWMIVVMLEHFNLVHGDASKTGFWTSAGRAGREMFVGPSVLASLINISLGRGKDMVAFMMMVGFTDSRDPVRFRDRDAVMLLMAVFLSGPCWCILTPSFGPLQNITGVPEDTPLVAQGWFLYSALFTRLVLIACHRYGISAFKQVVGAFLLACLFPDDPFLAIPEAWWVWIHRTYGGFLYFDFRRSFLFLPACNLLAFHYGHPAVNLARKWAPKRSWLVATLVGGCWLGYLGVSLLNTVELTFKAIYVETPRLGSHFVTLEYMLHPSFLAFLVLWIYEALILILPVLLVSVALAYCPLDHFQIVGRTSFGNYVLHPCVAAMKVWKKVQVAVCSTVTSPTFGVVGNTSILFVWNACFCIAFALTVSASFHFLLVRLLQGLGAACTAMRSSSLRSQARTGCPGYETLL